MTAQPAKFTFDLDLGRIGERRSLVTETRLDAMVAEARAAGYQHGLMDGEAAATAQASRRLANAAEDIAAQAARLHAALDEARLAALREAVDLATSVGRKLATHLIAREPAAEIEALIAECLASLEGVPHLVIRCHPDLADAVRDIATARMATSSFAGRLVVLGDPDQALGDGRIEWVDGGLVRNFNDINTTIDARIANFLAARGAGLSEENEL